MTGKKWAEIPLAENGSTGEDASFLATVKSLASRLVSKREVNTFKGIWRHPAKGTGQICDMLVGEILKAGARIHYKAQVTEMASAQGLIHTVTAQIGPETIQFKPAHVISSIPIEFLLRFLLPERPALGGESFKASGAAKRTVVLVYLFLNEEPRFPHAWLQVTCSSTRIGRITNYSAFSADMVPKGKTCLCCEMYCFGPDKLLEMDDQAVVQLTLADCAKSQLLDPATCFDHLVLRLPGADASQNRDNWMSKARLKLLAEVEPFKNLYYVNRTETDIATLAGLEAAEAILSGDRSRFDRRFDPAELGIRSESKAFSFDLPAAVES